MRALSVTRRGWIGSEPIECGEHHARGASDGSKVSTQYPLSPDLVVGCLFLSGHGINTRRAGSLPSVP